MILNSMGLPQPFVSACESDYKPTPRRYSATTLLKGTRQAILQRRHYAEIDTDASDMVFAILGRAVHKVLEEGKAAPDELQEGYLTVEMANGYELSGIFDGYKSSERMVYDYKTCSVNKYKFNDWKDYRKQLLIYAWMLNENGFPCDRGQIVALFKDFSPTKAKRERDYPRHPVFVKTFDFTPDELRGVGEWLGLKFAEIEWAEKLPDDELPTCTPEERWATPEKHAVMKKGRKKAVKLYDDRAQADIHALEIGGYVEHRPGIDRRCADYCSCCAFCDYYKTFYGGDSE